MGDRNGCLAEFDHIHGGLVAAVRDIREHTDLVHLGKHCLAKVSETTGNSFGTAGADKVGIVIGHLHNTNTQLIEYTKLLKGVFNGVWILEGKHDGLLAGGLCRIDVIDTSGNCQPLALVIRQVINTADRTGAGGIALAAGRQRQEKGIDLAVQDLLSHSNKTDSVLSKSASIDNQIFFHKI